MKLRWRIAATLASIVVLTACDEPAPQQVTPPWHPNWTKAEVPMPAGSPGRIVLRDAAVCGGNWYVTGGVEAPDGETRPAMWSSTDGRAWNAMRLTPLSYYGERSVVFSAACRAGKLAAIGAKRGGAHGNPRTSSWYQQADGSMIEVVAVYTLFGGADAVNVSRMTTGPLGWIISGNRVSGAAAWISPDAKDFTLLEAAPELANDDRGEPWSADAVATESGWLMVGGIRRPGQISRDPLAWTSSDGEVWRRVEVPGTADYDELQRVTMTPAGPVAAGLQHNSFGTWRVENGQWRAAGSFGDPGPKGTGSVKSLAFVGGRLVATVTNGSEYQVWASADRGGSWQPVVVPAAAGGGSGRLMSVTDGDGRAVLVVDDGTSATLWLSDGTASS